MQKNSCQCHFKLTIYGFQHNLFHLPCSDIDIENNISHAQTWHNQAINCLYCIAGPPTGCRLNPASGSSQVPLPALKYIGSLVRFYLNLNLPRKSGSATTKNQEISSSARSHMPVESFHAF
jgi:hypothetical protein